MSGIFARPRLKPLAEQVIVVTGASSGNGLAIAREAAGRGAAVVLAARSGPALAAIVEDLRSQGRRAEYVVADVANEQDVETIACRAIEAFGGFDSWINNAGVGIYGTLDQVPTADHRRTFEVNYFGTLYGSLIAARHLRTRSGGAIVNVGSVLGDRSIVLQGPYSATKYAVEGLTETLRVELEREGSGICVTLVKPGGCGTPYPQHARNYMDVPPRVPPPLYDPRVVADAVLFACATPRRTLYVGSGALLESLAGRIAPRMTDWVTRLVGDKIQQTPQAPDDPAKRDNLYEPRLDGAEKTSQPVHMRRRSLFLQAQKLPRIAQAAALIGIGAATVIGTRLHRRG